MNTTQAKDPIQETTASKPLRAVFGHDGTRIHSGHLFTPGTGFNTLPISRF